LIQTLVNASFGIIVAFGLYFIGIPSPILWGITAFLLRFIPYIGPFIAAVFPIALAAAVDPGWGIANRNVVRQERVITRIIVSPPDETTRSTICVVLNPVGASPTTGLPLVARNCKHQPASII
jgi:AI-2E family transporter